MSSIKCLWHATFHSGGYYDTYIKVDTKGFVSEFVLSNKYLCFYLAY